MCVCDGREGGGGGGRFVGEILFLHFYAPDFRGCWVQPGVPCGEADEGCQDIPGRLNTFLPLDSHLHCMIKNACTTLELASCYTGCTICHQVYRPYLLNQTPQLLFISSRNFVRLLFKSGY